MPTRRIVSTAAALGERWAGIPGIEATAKGRLFVTWFSGGSTEPEPDNCIYVTTSDDGGVSFASPVAVANPHDGARAFDPGLWIDPLGRLWLTYNRGDAARALHTVVARRCDQPDAAVPQWSDEFPINLDAPYAFRLNKPTVLSTGAWLLPVTHAAERIPEWFAAERQRQGVAISHDQGVTWTLHGSVHAPYWALENMIMERRDGSVTMYIRSGAGALWSSRSLDGGQTWSDGAPTTIANPGSRYFIRALADGDWLLINSPDPTRRTGLVASRSSDEGATWRGKLVLDERDDVSYPDAAITADGTVYVVHDRDRRGAAEINLSSFHLSELR